MRQPIITVTLNPALDITGNLEKLHLGHVNRVNSSPLLPAGKGVNVAKVLADLGAKVTVTGFLGCDNRAKFDQLFLDNAIENQFIEVTGSTRTNIKLVDAKQQVTDINFDGFHVTQSDIAELEQRLLVLSEHSNYFVFAGSLPSGLSPDTVAHWTKTLQGKGCKVILDSSGDMLQKGVVQHPYMIKPNEHEFSELLNDPQLIENQTELVNRCAKSAREVQSRGISNVLISLGEQGLIWSDEGACLHATPPNVEIKSTVGAGDSVVAGFVWAKVNNFTASEAVIFCTAMGAYAVSQVGVGVTAMSDVEALARQVTVRCLRN